MDVEIDNDLTDDEDEGILDIEEAMHQDEDSEYKVLEISTSKNDFACSKLLLIESSVRCWLVSFFRL